MTDADDTCHCEERRAAMMAGTFGWNPLVKGYVDATVPWRHTAIRWRTAAYGDVKQHVPVGKPYTFADCPWCGKPLDEPLYGEGTE